MKKIRISMVGNTPAVVNGVITDEANKKCTQSILLSSGLKETSLKPSMFKVTRGDIFVRSYEKEIFVWRVHKILPEKNEVILRLINLYRNRKWMQRKKYLFG